MKALKWLLAVAMATAVSCAKFPDEPDLEFAKRIVFNFTVEGEINPDYVYIVAITTSQEENPTVDGPVPVIGPPWGNGFVAGTVDTFIRWDPLASPEFLIYRFQNEDLIDFLPVGTPIQVEEVQPGATRIQFEVDLNQIAPSVDVAPQLQTLLVNFLTMDRVPQGTDTANKNWDALGNSVLPSEVDDYVIIPLDEPGIFDDQRFNDLEPQGDVLDPDLDIVDWSIQVRTNN